MVRFGYFGVLFFVALFRPIRFISFISLLPKRVAAPASSQRHNKNLNTGHAITAYLGKLAGHQTIRDAILDKKIRAVVQGAMEESGAVLIKRYALDPQMHAA